MKKTTAQRVLAVDLRAQRFGYAVFEGSGTLLDWGLKSYVAGDRSSLKSKLTQLQSMYAPLMILVRQRDELNPVRRAKIHRVFYALKMVAPRIVAVTTRSTANSVLSNLSGARAKINKYDITQLVARRFPELSWQLPAKRQIWQSEAASQPIFDAAGLGVLHFARENLDAPHNGSAGGWTLSPAPQTRRS